MLAGKKILLGITGSIAAYKTPILVRQLIKAGAEVRVIMTPAAQDFVTSLTLSTLSKSPVLSELFDESTWANHVMLGRWADVLLIAPLSCNTLSKMAHGACDNLLLATYLSATCPVVIVPAMDEDMWRHPATKRNLEVLKKDGCHQLGVRYGELASGLIGEGRMAEPDEIVGYLDGFFAEKQVLKGKKAFVTAGPTYEPFDPVRYIGNYSSGKMGVAIAKELESRGAEVTLIAGPMSISTEGLDRVNVSTAEEMYIACTNRPYDIAVMAAAVADYTPVEVSNQKIKKQNGEFTLTLKKTKDILSALGQIKQERQFLVGFALETENEKEYALKKLKDKHADLIVLNSLRDAGAGFGHDSNKATLYFKNGGEKILELKSKTALAKDIVDAIVNSIS